MNAVTTSQISMNEPQAINGPCTGEGEMEQLDRQVANLLGLIIGPTGYDQNSRPLRPYSADLNACHEFEKTVIRITYIRSEQYLMHLRKLCVENNEDAKDASSAYATAEQRCRAFVKTLEASPVPKAPESATATGASIPKSSSSEGTNQ